MNCVTKTDPYLFGGWLISCPRRLSMCTRVFHFSVKCGLFAGVSSFVISLGMELEGRRSASDSSIFTCSSKVARFSDMQMHEGIAECESGDDDLRTANDQSSKEELT